MVYSNTSITSEDVNQWITDFTKAFVIIDCIEEITIEDDTFLKNRICDALFLVAYVESQLKIDVDDKVYNRALELQRNIR